MIPVFMNDKYTFTLPSIEDIIENHGAIFYDCDGVLTDNRVLVTEQGSEAVFFNRSDGIAISFFRENAIHQAIISTETNDVVERRAEKLKLPVIHKLDSTGTDKGSVLSSYAEENNINLSHSIFIGNDINDLPALKLVGYPCCPADAEEEILTFIKERTESLETCEKQPGERGIKGAWISTRRGGYGVVREMMRELGV